MSALVQQFSKLFITLFLASLVGADFAVGAEVDSMPKNPVSLDGFSKRMEPDKLLTTGGAKIQPADDITLEPEFGVSHSVYERDIGNGLEDKTHRVHAQAGANITLSDRFRLGFATKLPIYNYGATEKQTPGGGPQSSISDRHEYEILRISPNNLTLTGEMGFRLGEFIDLNLYYDQNRIKAPLQPGLTSEEEVIGTKFIFRFK